MQETHLPENDLFSRVRAVDYPCVMAKSVLHAKNAHTISAGAFCPVGGEVEKNLHAVYRAVDVINRTPNAYHSVVLLFDELDIKNEEAFDAIFWAYLQSLHDLDAKQYGWDKNVSSDVTSENFSFSLTGRAFYVIGMHPKSARLSRRMPYPVIIFNPHDQFERLRNRGNYGKIRDAIRNRDAVYSGSKNPMMDNFGESSEALQYTGKKIDKETWTCPFHLRKTTDTTRS